MAKSKLARAVRSEPAPEYLTGVYPEVEARNAEMLEEDALIDSAIEIIYERMSNAEAARFASSADVEKYCQLRWSREEREVFSVLLLDTRHRLIKVEELTQGTIDSATIHPREVVKAALRANAAAVVFTHNHPSGDPTPSHADQNITLRLRNALDLVGVRVLDHVVVGAEGCVSLSGLGLM